MYAQTTLLPEPGRFVSTSSKDCQCETTACYGQRKYLRFELDHTRLFAVFTNEYKHSVAVVKGLQYASVASQNTQQSLQNSLNRASLSIVYYDNNCYATCRLLCTSISIYVNNFISCWFIASRFFTRKYCYFVEKRPRGSLPSYRLSCSSYRQDSEGWGELIASVL